VLRLSKRAFVAVDTTISTRPLTRESVKDKGITARNNCIPRIWTRSSRCTVRKAAQSHLRHPLHKLKMLTTWTRPSSFASLRTSSTQFHKYCQAVYENLLQISTWLAGTAKCLASPRSTIFFSRTCQRSAERLPAYSPKGGIRSHHEKHCWWGQPLISNREYCRHCCPLNRLFNHHPGSGRKCSKGTTLTWNWMKNCLKSNGKATKLIHFSTGIGFCGSSREKTSKN
jgi:hypothetical protein